MATLKIENVLYPFTSQKKTRIYIDKYFKDKTLQKICL